MCGRYTLYSSPQSIAEAFQVSHLSDFSRRPFKTWRTSLVSAKLAAIGFGLTCILYASNAPAQHLWWNLMGMHNATCIYGEITVLATHPGIYYCGANWHPGEPAGGYCGIQHNGPAEKRTIFSIWDTAPELHPKVTVADAKTIFNRFGGEGTGAYAYAMALEGR